MKINVLSTLLTIKIINLLNYKKNTDFCQLKLIIYKMKILSITFHAVESILPLWETYLHNDFFSQTTNLTMVNKCILSEVETEMLSEGKNYNLLLFFENESHRNEFIENEFYNLEEHIHRQFGDNIMIFKTFINPIKEIGNSEHK